MNRPRFRDARFRYYDEAERMYNLDYQRGRQAPGNVTDSNLENFNQDQAFYNPGNQFFSPGYGTGSQEGITQPDLFFVEYWVEPGPFQGVGPSNYNRSDDRIRDEIHYRLTRHGHLDARNIHVDINHGEVTLTGSVRDRHAKRMAEDSIDTVSGVTQVHNQLSIQHGISQGQQEKQGNQRNQQSSSRQKTSSQRSLQTTSQSQKQQSGVRGAGAGTATGVATQQGTSQLKSQIKEGVEVVGSQGKSVGTVKQVRSNDFLVDRPVARDIFVPFSAAHFENGKVRLNVTADQVDDQNWDTPEFL